MVRALVVAALALQQGDTATFQDGATATLYALARQRHIYQDTLVRDYQATVHTRLEASAGKSRFARQTTLMAHETTARITWKTPNDLKIQVLGTRAKIPLVGMLSGLADVDAEVENELRNELIMDRPWFIPRAFGDSIRVMGVPEHAALHPLAAGATAYYRFAIVDSVEVRTPGHVVRAKSIKVEPKRFGPALVAGTMWVDAETGDVVRMRMLFLGDYLWDEPSGTTPEDSAAARRDNDEAKKYLTVEAEIEYALINQRYWMPYRQFLGITAQIPIFLDLTIPARAVTTFSEYDVNVDPTLVFAIPEDELEKDGRRRRQQLVKPGGRQVDDRAEAVRDRDDARRENGYYQGGTWDDGRWEIDVPPAESLAAYRWSTEFKTELDQAAQERLRETFAELAKLENELPSEWTGKRRFGVAWEAAADIFRFNRVQGVSLGLGYEVKPRIAYTSLLASARFSFGDKRLTGSVTARRDGPYARIDLSGYRDVREVESWTRGIGIGNSLNALFVGHDDADYFLATGGRFSVTWNDRWRQNMTLHVAVERHDSMPAETTNNIWGSPTWGPTPPVAVGTFLRYGLTRDDRVAGASVQTGLELTTDMTRTAGRGWASVEVPFVVARRTGRLVLRGAVIRGENLPQVMPRLGGPQTVRGYAYGTRIAKEMWSAQLDYALFRRGFWTPVLFADIGDTFTGDPLIGVGGGLSLLNGLIRLDVAKGVRPDADVRFDLVFRAYR
jgi:hypothetical protein